MQVSGAQRFVRLVTLVACVILAAACNKFKEIDVTSCEVMSLTPKGFRSVDAVLGVGVYNPTVSFTLSDVTGNIRKDDLVIATFSGGPITIDKKSEKVYELPCTLMLEEGLSLFQVLTLIKTMDFEGYVIDASGVVSLSNGLKKNLQFKEIPVNSLLDKETLKDSFKL